MKKLIFLVAVIFVLQGCANYADKKVLNDKETIRKQQERLGVKTWNPPPFKNKIPKL